MKTYRDLIGRQPTRVAVIGWLLSLAAWMAKPSIFGVKILEHYDVDIEIDTGELSRASYNLQAGTIRVNSFKAFTYRRKALTDIEQMMADAQAALLGANDQNPQGKDPFA